MGLFSTLDQSTHAESACLQSVLFVKLACRFLSALHCREYKRASLGYVAYRLHAHVDAVNYNPDGRRKSMPIHRVWLLEDHACQPSRLFSMV